MIISFKYKYIFIAIPKTAGHAVRMVLRNTMAENDWEQCGLFEQKIFPNPVLAKIGHGHISASQLEAELPGDSYHSFFSFAFVRNPYDRFVSYCTFINRNNQKMKLDSAGTMKSALKDCEGAVPVLLRPQSSFVTDSDGEIMVSYIARYEKIQLELDDVLKKIHTTPVRLPVVNRSDHRPYRDYYDLELKEMVDHHYHTDFQLFGYAKELHGPA